MDDAAGMYRFGDSGSQESLSTESWIDIAAALLAIIALFGAGLAEARLIRMSRRTLREIIEGHVATQRVQSLIDDPQVLRSVSLIATALSASAAGLFIGRFIQRDYPAYSLLVAIVVIIVTVALVVRVIPAIFASKMPEGDSERSSRLDDWLGFVASPVILLSDLLVRLLGLPTDYLVRSRVEIESVAESTHGQNGGSGYETNEHHEDESEADMITNVLALETAFVRDIMIPRLDMLAVSIDSPVQEVVDIAIRAGHSRIPVYEDTIDQIVGLVYAKDLLRFVREDAEDINLDELIRPGYFVPESKHVDELLSEMRKARVHMAIVVDEYGGTAGLVTIEDVIEEIVGEIQDEYDQESPMIERIGPGEIVVDGRIPVDDVADALDIEIAEDPSGTIGGYVQKHLGHIPKRGERVETGMMHMLVEAVEQHRVRKVRIRRLSEELTQAAVSGSDAHS